MAGHRQIPHAGRLRLSRLRRPGPDVGVNDLATTHPELAKQWHPTKNGVLMPQDVVAGNSRKVWWLCPKGHAWQAKVYSRACGGAGCPVCAGKLVVAGENDLESQFPAIAAQWHPEKNGTLLPSAVSPYSNRRVWWRDELGHVWQATVSARTQHGSGCPYCSGKTALPGFNDLATLAPEVAAQWHPTLNGTLTPDQVTAGTQNGVVGVSQRAYLESHRLFQSGAAEMRLSRLCRQSPPGAAGTLLAGTGGGGSKTGPVSQFSARKKNTIGGMRSEKTDLSNFDDTLSAHGVAAGRRSCRRRR